MDGYVQYHIGGGSGLCACTVCACLRENRVALRQLVGCRDEVVGLGAVSGWNTYIIIQVVGRGCVRVRYVHACGRNKVGFSNLGSVKMDFSWHN